MSSHFCEEYIDFKPEGNPEEMLKIAQNVLIGRRVVVSGLNDSTKASTSPRDLERSKLKESITVVGVKPPLPFLKLENDAVGLYIIIVDVRRMGRFEYLVHDKTVVKYELWVEEKQRRTTPRLSLVSEV